jgi:hypothetical protein
MDHTHVMNLGLVSGLLFYGLILVGALLRLFPILAFTTVLKDKVKLVAIVIMVLIVGGLGYTLATLDDLKSIYQATEKATQMSYGGMAIFATVFGKLKGSFDPWAFSLTGTQLIAFAASLLLVLALGHLSAMWADSLCGRDVDELSYQHINSYRLGARIHVGAHFLGSNYDYRLISLLCTIPQVLAWVESHGWLCLTASFALAGTITTLWLSQYLYHVG